MAKAVALVQGASRGLGLQFCRHVLHNHPSAAVVATCRKPASAPDLASLQQQFSDRLTILALDAGNEEHIKSAAEIVKEQHGKLDLLINSAGMLHPSGKGETSLREVSSQGLLDTLAVNSVGPLLMAKHFSPLLTKGTGEFGFQDGKKHKAVIVNMSAKVGSITDNGLGGWYSYRMSKAALNMATKNLSIELGRGSRKVICVSLHPGTVNTDLSRPYHKNVAEGKLFSVEYSVDCLMTIVNNLKAKDTGKFFVWDQSEMPF